MQDHNNETETTAPAASTFKLWGYVEAQPDDGEPYNVGEPVELGDWDGYPTQDAASAALADLDAAAAAALATLREAARAVVDNWERGDLAEAVTELGLLLDDDEPEPEPVELFARRDALRREAVELAEASEAEPFNSKLAELAADTASEADQVEAEAYKARAARLEHGLALLLEEIEHPEYNGRPSAALHSFARLLVGRAPAWRADASRADRLYLALEALLCDVIEHKGRLTARAQGEASRVLAEERRAN